jgi:hypothetical protein
VYAFHMWAEIFILFIEATEFVFFPLIVMKCMYFMQNLVFKQKYDTNNWSKSFIIGDYVLWICVLYWVKKKVLVCLKLKLVSTAVYTVENV